MVRGNQVLANRWTLAKQQASPIYFAGCSDGHVGGDGGNAAMVRWTLTVRMVCLRQGLLLLGSTHLLRNIADVRRVERGGFMRQRCSSSTLSGVFGRD